MKSPRGLLAASTFLLALPVTVLYEKLFGSGAETVIHLALALGAAFAALAVFDFKTARWMTWLGCVSTAAVAVIFLLQGVSHLIQSESLTYLAYAVLGQWPELFFTDLFFLWCIAALRTNSQGKIRILGIVTLSTVVGLEVVRFSLTYLGTSLNAAAPSLKILYLLPFVWLFFESKIPTMPVALKPVAKATSGGL
jgi:hypothetical protein